MINKFHQVRPLIMMHNQLFPMIHNISQSNNQFFLSKVLMDTDYTIYKNSEGILDIRLLFLDFKIILEDSISNGFPRFNIELMLMFTISKFKFNSSHSYVMLILKLIIMEVHKKLQFCKLMKEYSMKKVTSIMLIIGVKLNNLILTKLSKMPTNTFFLNSHI